MGKAGFQPIKQELPRACCGSGPGTFKKEVQAMEIQQVPSCPTQSALALIMP